MKHPWQLYDDLVDLVPGDLRVAACVVSHWAAVTDDRGATGVAMTYRSGPYDHAVRRDFAGRPLRDLAGQVRSWDLELASLGAAALNCALTTPARLAGWHEQEWTAGVRSTFDLHAVAFAERRVGVIGHFGSLDRLRETAHDLVVLERNPRGADLPDPAAEYALADRDIVFITGSTVINKTLPRLLELCADAEVILVGPSTPFAPEVFTTRVRELGGSVCTEPAGLVDLVATGASLSELRPRMRQFNISLPLHTHSGETP